MSCGLLRNIIAFLICAAFTLNVAIAQESFRPKDSINYNHYLKLDVVGLIGLIANNPRYGIVKLSIQYESLLKNRQTFGAGVDFRRYSHSWSEFWIRPQWRYYFGSSFKGFYVGAMVTYVHQNVKYGYTSQEYTSNYVGFGGMTGVQLIASKRFLLELNYRLSRQFSPVQLYDNFSGQTYYGSPPFNMGTIELNVGYGLGRKKK